MEKNKTNFKLLEDILRAIKDEYTTKQEISQRCQIGRATVSRYVERTLEMGYIVYDKKVNRNDVRYRLPKIGLELLRSLTRTNYMFEWINDL